MTQTGGGGGPAVVFALCRYNNQSVNENWHVAQAFGLLNREDGDLAWDEEWTEDQIFKFRKLCISMVLATDMARHFELLGKFKARVAECDDACTDAYDPAESKDRESVLVMAIKACDIGTQGKKWKLARKWATIVQEEFFSQGDKEKMLGMLPSPLCDREAVDIVKSQIGFIDAVLFPLYEPLSKVLPELKSVLAQLEHSKSMYEQELATRRQNSREKSKTR
uniref:PDEase domain-containing protein n=1 Tax=Phaeocystis cordata TaxID=118079 RepID=A0A7S1MZX4_9EUKA